MEHLHDDDDKPKQPRTVKGLVPAPWSRGAEAASGHAEQKLPPHHVPLESILHMQQHEQQLATDKAHRAEKTDDDDEEETSTSVTTPKTAEEPAEALADESREVEVPLHNDIAAEEATDDNEDETAHAAAAPTPAQSAGSAMPSAPPLAAEAAAFTHVGAPYRSATATLERPAQAAPAGEPYPLTAGEATGNPLFEAAYDASVPLNQEFEAFVRQEAAAGVPLQDMETGPAEATVDDDPTGAVFSGDGPAGPPPIPPAEHMPLGGDDEEPDPRTYAQPSYAYAPPDAFARPQFNTAPTVSHEQAAPLDYDNEVYGRRRFLKGFLTGVAVAGYIARRRGNRLRQEMADTSKHAERQQAATEDQVTVLQTANERLDTRVQAAESQLRQHQAERPANPMTAVGLAETGRPSMPKPEAVRAAPAPSAEQQQAEQVEHAPDGTPLAPGQRVERAGWYSVVKDEHNQVVENVLEAGQAMKEERQQEQMRDAVNDNDPRAADPAAQKAFYRTIGHATLPSGLTQPSLPAGDTTRQQADHRLQSDVSPKKQFVTNLTNPWFWLMLILLVLAFFTANLIG